MLIIRLGYPNLVACICLLLHLEGLLADELMQLILRLSLMSSYETLYDVEKQLLDGYGYRLS